ncbi:hypothetical protein BHE74_00044095 [Ensete ventricosum]|nr:hypothetical protein BHE74_00044095 [Ensete ventricosum]RZR97805.1 hypothetical protein BHM03_00027047 [Ensete ventricosum]
MVLEPSKGKEDEGQQGWPGHLQGGGWLQLRPPCRGATGCGQAPSRKGHDRLRLARKGLDQLRLARKGLPPMARPQGAVARGAPARGGYLWRTCKGAASPAACAGAATVTA